MYDDGDEGETGSDNGSADKPRPRASLGNTDDDIGNFEDVDGDVNDIKDIDGDAKDTDGEIGYDNTSIIEQSLSICNGDDDTDDETSCDDGSGNERLMLPNSDEAANADVSGIDDPHNGET